MHVNRLRILGCVGVLLLVSPALAETVTLRAELKGSNEVPPLSVAGRGEVTAIYDPATKKLSWTGTLSNLTAKPTMAHFHGPAEPSKNAGIQVTIPNPGSSFSGEATLTDQQARDMLAGMWYVNIHTAAHPAGEIRGQLLK
jgi:hypothetical protein